MSNIILVTGATGKVGQTFINRLLADSKFDSFTVRALCHNRELSPHPRIQNIHGTIEHRDLVEKAMDGMTHVLHLATVKETPEQIMDVAVKGLFWLLEACRTSPTFKQLIMVGGDAGMGHFVYPHPIPVTETQNHSAYPGCYALSKVLEEVMLDSITSNTISMAAASARRGSWRRMTSNINSHSERMSSAVRAGVIWLKLNVWMN